MTKLQYPGLLEDRRELYLDLLTSKQLADIRLVTEDGRETRAHRVILSSASPSLSNILLELSESHQDTAITLVGLSYQDIGQVLGLIYTGELSCHQADIDRLTEIARHLGLGQIAINNEIKREDEDLQENVEEEKWHGQARRKRRKTT